MFVTKNRIINVVKCCLLMLISLTIAVADDAEKKTNPGEQAIVEANKTITNIDTATLQQLLKENPKIEMVDVREANEIEFIGAYIDADESVNITRSWLEFDIGAHIKSKNSPIVVYCGTNQRKVNARLIVIFAKHVMLDVVESGGFTV